MRDASARAGNDSAIGAVIASEYVSPAPSRSVPFSRDHPRSSATSFRLRSASGRAAVEVQRDHHVGSALDRNRVRVLCLEAKRLVQRAGGQDVHDPFVLPLFPYVRNPERGRSAEPALREPRRHERRARRSSSRREGRRGTPASRRPPGLAERTEAPRAPRRGTRRRGRAPPARTRRSRARSRSSPRPRRACRLKSTRR